jgi:EAL domain-containing protein (putative c-di-GMP-specific phosphodiesterase class I)/GGDEF domain-containing protein
VLLVAVVDGLRELRSDLGDRAADAVLREVAQRLTERLEPADTVARAGPDSFGILTDHALDTAGACALGDRLVEEVGGSFDLASRPIPVALGIGVAADGELDEGDDAVRAGEMAARRALELGGSRSVVHTHGATAAHRSRADIEQELREAIDTAGWWLDYQPIIDLRTERVVSCEALIRWADGRGRPVPPTQLIGMAEEIGLIVPLGERVLERACLDTLGWADRGERVTVAVNVSARQLTEPGFTRSFADALRRTGTDPGVVTVELTEASFSGDPSRLRSLLGELSDLGVDLAMDDFGTAYSSLAQLGGLPLAGLKLDRSFVADVAASPQRRHLVEGVVTLAHALGLLVIAEGVEDEDQLAVLRELGCDRAQGFLLSRPLPPEELGDQLEPERRDDLDGIDPVTRALIDRYG